MNSPVQAPTSPESSALRISWAWLSVGLATLAVGALGTLAVVATVSEADSLSTIALALAIVAFSAQLIVSLAQGFTSAQQVATVERVNADTQAALGALRATSDGILRMQREHFGTVLQAALDRSISSLEVESDSLADSESLEPSGVSQADAELAVIRRLQETLGADVSGVRTLAPGPHATPRYAELTTYPAEDEGIELARELSRLSPWAAQRLTKLAKNAVTRSRRGLRTGGWATQQAAEKLGPANRELVDAGLMSYQPELNPQSGREEVFIDLTDKGVRVASLIVGDGSAPDWLMDFVESERAARSGD